MKDKLHHCPKCETSTMVDPYTGVKACDDCGTELVQGLPDIQMNRMLYSKHMLGMLETPSDNQIGKCINANRKHYLEWLKDPMSTPLPAIPEEAG